MSRFDWLPTAGSRLRAGWRPVVEATAAATVAWLIATRLVGHPRPFFAPAAALIVLGQARGQRTRRAVEVLLGVAAGVLVADVVAQALGPHTTWTIFTIILVTLTVTVAIGASVVVRVQMAVSALYVAVVTPSTGSLVPFRFVDALVGGVVALVANQLVRPRNPLVELAAESHVIFEEVAGVIDDAADALERHDEAGARAAGMGATGATRSAAPPAAPARCCRSRSAPATRQTRSAAAIRRCGTVSGYESIRQGCRWNCHACETASCRLRELPRRRC